FLCTVDAGAHAGVCQECHPPSGTPTRFLVSSGGWLASLAGESELLDRLRCLPASAHARGVCRGCASVCRRCSHAGGAVAAAAPAPVGTQCTPGNAGFSAADVLVGLLLRVPGGMLALRLEKRCTL